MTVLAYALAYIVVTGIAGCAVGRFLKTRSAPER